MYQALYRKWRPKTFDEVVGQPHITETLKNQVLTGRLSHAYLFIGTRGTGKTTCAKILARAVNCEHPVNGNPCNQCASCRGIEDGSILDVVELDAASNNGVDNVRALRDEAVFSPASVKKRVYIIDEVHMLSVSAFNALLKILEEPPSHLMFILATTELHKVPATILSRCQRHSFKRLDSGAIAKQLRHVAQKEGVDLPENAANLLARLADGAMRDGLSLLDQCAGDARITPESVLSAMGLAGNARTAQLLEAISDHDTERTLELFRGLWQDGKEPSTLLEELCTLERDVLMTLVAPKGCSELLSGGYDVDTLAALAERFDAAQLIWGLDVLRSACAGLRDRPSPRTGAEICLIRLCRPELAESTLHADRPKSDTAKPVPERETLQRKPVQKAEKKPLPKLSEPEHDTPQKPEPDNIPWRQEVSEPLQEPLATQAEFAPEKAEEAVFSEMPETLPQAQGNLWDQVLKRMEAMLPVGTYALISDPFHGSGSAEGETLVVRAKSAFAKSMFSTPEVTEALRSAAAQVMGHAIPVKVISDDGNASSGANRLESLGMFSNVTFE